jgi:molybdopterin synthase catalytic subunit
LIENGSKILGAKNKLIEIKKKTLSDNINISHQRRRQKENDSLLLIASLSDDREAPFNWFHIIIIFIQKKKSIMKIEIIFEF